MLRIIRTREERGERGPYPWCAFLSCVQSQSIAGYQVYDAGINPEIQGLPLKHDPKWTFVLDSVKNIA